MLNDVQGFPKVIIFSCLLLLIGKDSDVVILFLEKKLLMLPLPRALCEQCELFFSLIGSGTK